MAAEAPPHRGGARDEPFDVRHARHKLSRALSLTQVPAFESYSKKKQSTIHRAPVGQGPSGPGWLAIAFGFGLGGRLRRRLLLVLATGTAWEGLCLIHHQSKKNKP